MRRVRCFGWPAVLVVVAMVGCGGGGGTQSTTSHEELTEFLQENPEYADAPATTTGDKDAAAASPLEL